MDDLGGLADLHLEIDAGFLLKLDGDASLLFGFEAFGGGGYGVVADVDEREGVVAFVVADGGAGGAGAGSTEG